MFSQVGKRGGELDIGLVPNSPRENQSGQPGKTGWRVLYWVQSVLPEPVGI